MDRRTRPRRDLFSGTKDVAESHRFDEVEARRVDGGQCRRLCRPARASTVQGRPVQPDLPARHADPEIRPAPQAAAASCCRPRTPSIANIRVISALYPTGFPVASPTRSAPTRASSARCSTSWTWSKAASSGTARCRSDERTIAAPLYEAKIATLAELHNTDHEASRPRRLRQARQLLRAARSIAGRSNTS